jgi:ABC-type amino acid transport system permease subunit
MVESGRSIGWREVLIVGAIAVGAVLGVQILAAFVPAVDTLFRGTPVIVIGLIVSTGYVLWRIAATRPPEP